MGYFVDGRDGAFRSTRSRRVARPSSGPRGRWRRAWRAQPPQSSPLRACAASVLRSGSAGCAREGATTPRQSAGGRAGT